MAPSRRKRCNVYWAFTLIELITSMAIMSVLMVAMGSAVLLASKAIPNRQSQPDTLIESGQVLRRICEELRTAIYVNTSSNNTVAFTVADRASDGVPEVISYSWSGTAGDPLTRQANGGTAVTVLDDVQQFDLSYEVKGVSEEYPGVLIESAEQVLSSYDPAVAGADFDTTTSNWVGQYFQPTLPADAISWKITRVLVMTKKDGGANGVVQLQLRQPDGSNLPSTTELKTNDIWENWLTTSYAWYDNAIELSNLTPGQGLCLALKRTEGSDTVGVYNYESNGGSGYVETLDGGGTWSGVANQSLLYYVYGTYSTAPPSKTVTREHLTGVRMTLQAGDHLNSEVETAVRTLNAPQVVSAYWELDFNADPRIVDTNADGTGDWIKWTGSNGVLDPADLIDGVWHSPSATGFNYTTLTTIPDNDFTELITVDARYRATSVGGGWGASFEIHADRSGSQCAVLYAVLSKPDATTQELKIGNRLPSGDGWENWLAILSVPDDFVDVKLIIDPTDDTIAVFVNGVHQGTYTYTEWRNDNDAGGYIYSYDCSVEFDSVRIRVGGSSP